MSELLETWGVVLSIGILVLGMAYVVWDLARSNDAGKLGTLILFGTLTMGIMGLLIKVIIQLLLESNL